jgi:hypothetical protein
MPSTPPNRWLTLVVVCFAQFIVPVGVGVALAALRWVPESSAGLTGDQRRFDLAGAVSVSLGLLGAFIVVSGARARRWSSCACSRSARCRRPTA